MSVQPLQPHELPEKMLGRAVRRLEETDVVYPSTSLPPLGGCED